MQVKIKVMGGASAGKEVTLRGPRFLIGRATDCNLRVNSDAISRRHCRFKIEGSRVSIKDLGSRNGTFVNGNKIEADHKLKTGDQLRVGPLELLVLVEDVAKSKVSTKRAKPVGEDMGGLVGDWLDEAEDLDNSKVAEAETRQLSTEDTDRLALGNTVQMPVPDKSEKAKDEDKKDKDKEPEVEGEADEKAKKKSDTGIVKAPTRAEKNAPKDTHEAASQMLKKFFNRG